jgi:2,5-dioxopentanoate dehydrogenase
MVQPILRDGVWHPAEEPLGTFHARDPRSGEAIPDPSYPVSSWRDLEALLAAGARAAAAMSGLPAEALADFLEGYAGEIEGRADDLVAAAHRETGLAAGPRLREMELPRATRQLRLAAAAARDRSWRRATIDAAEGLRSIHGPLGGPVLVLGPNNFPLAYNGIAGGDFAGALAAGNPVIAKAHPAHPRTTTLLAEAALAALAASSLPAAAVQLFYHTDPALGRRMVAHPALGALAFTGSRAAGLDLKAAADAAGKPAYLELSSLNPVVLLPGALEERGEAIAEALHASCTAGGGQFCTKPGLLLLQAGAAAERFLDDLAARFAAQAPSTLLTAGIPARLAEVVAAWREAGAELLAGGTSGPGPGFSFRPTLLRGTAGLFRARAETLGAEAFGPVALAVVARDEAELGALLERLEGNLTGSLYTATGGEDDAAYARWAPVLRRKVGRLLNDKVPTGVTVCPAMNHGGPFPATGHPGFTAVGFPASMLRFTALHSYDQVRPHRLPPELRDGNPTGAMWRLIDGEWTTADLAPGPS